jgi:orotate phosphoribosyltransferase
MILDKDTANKTAELLLQIKAIKLNPNDPYTWASGWKSPIYCDNRISLSYPTIRNFIKSELVNLIEEKYGRPDVIAGVATGAIAIGALVAQEMGLPFIYIRPEAKKHGRQNQIEGNLEKGSNVVVVEDLISTGMSSLKAVEALNKESVKVMGMAAIFTYGFDVAEENFSNHKTELVTLSNYNHLIEEALSKGYVSKSELETLKEWRESPNTWKK